MQQYTGIPDCLAYIGITRAQKGLTELPAEDVRWTGEDIALDPGQPRERGQAHIAHLRGLLSS
jgi:hypothetical protein